MKRIITLLILITSGLSPDLSKGSDFMHERDNIAETQSAIDWWKAVVMSNNMNDNQPNGGTKEDSIKLSFSDFNYTDIGMATKPGSVTINNDEIKIIGGGADIWGTHDEFFFGYQRLTGNFDVSIQILNLDKANQYTKAGIMARADLSDSSQHVYFQVFPDNTPRNKNNGGCEFQYRSTKAAEMKAIYPDPVAAGNQFNVDFPNTWIRLKRQGDVFESYFSKDDKTWKLYSSLTLSMPQELFVGPAVTSHNSTEYTAARFASVRLVKQKL
jgi:regulation of enolase protein 1 (concanavalin A-like superfamily)